MHQFVISWLGKPLVPFSWYANPCNFLSADSTLEVYEVLARDNIEHRSTFQLANLPTSNDNKIWYCSQQIIEIGSFEDEKIGKLIMLTIVHSPNYYPLQKGIVLKLSTLGVLSFAF